MVQISPQAEADLRSTHQFILLREGSLRARVVYQELRTAILSLHTSPFRGKAPKELELLGGTDYLQIIADPYRVIYFLDAHVVQVLIVADGRRDFNSLLARRPRGQPS